ncbi:MAG: ABC transporter permease [Candidatus Delongbacteria bacterium]|nr:ABC transporter permease [Candidatus Delongbacteria bacterium]
MMKRIRAVMNKEIHQIYRDRRTLGLLLFIPAFLLFMFGYALNLDVNHISLAIYDQDKSQTSYEFYQSFLQSGYFDLCRYLSDPREIDRLMAGNEIKAAIIIPADFSNRLLKGRTPTIQFIIDGSNSNTANTVYGYMSAISLNFSSRIILQGLLKTGRANQFSRIEFKPRIWFNPELKTVRSLVPGLIAFILTVVAVISTSLSIVREKERGTMEQILVSSLNPFELVIGKLIPYIVVSLVSTIMILLVGYFLFGVAVKGSLILLFSVIILFLFSSLGMGLIISTMADTQQIAFLISVIISMLPTFVLSGFMFPLRNIPIPIRLISYSLPSTYFLKAILAIMLKGVGIAAIWKEMVFLLGFTTVVTGLSMVILKKREAL